MFWIRSAFRNVTPRPGSLAVGGLVERPCFGFTFDDFCRMPREHQVSDVGAFATPARLAPIEGPPLQGLRLAGLLEHVRPHPEAAFVNVRSHGTFQASVWRREIERLAIIAYARDGEPLAPELGGPFRLFLPGFRDEARDIRDLALIEISDRPGKDSRNERSEVPTHSSAAGEVQGGLARWRTDPSHPRTIVSPPPMA
jgi:DMSO/TMAO reductase YedYZ molybdopterin-dependent catalytic subunit